jgi:dTDP-4-dehydrorhamnose 3,5-epimerase
MIEGVVLTNLDIVNVPGGDVLHCMKEGDPGYIKFGEVYFSDVKPGIIKPWKRHKEMTLNLVVPNGQIRFVIYDDRSYSSTAEELYEVILSRQNYMRLTVPPGLWMAFQGLDNTSSMLLNIADIKHNPDETDRKNINEIKYNWEMTA